MVLGIDLRTNKTMMTSESSETAVKKGSTKHSCWGNRKNDSRYSDKLPSETYFIRFPKS